MKKLFLVGCIAAMFFACKEELPETPVESKFTIGMEYEGGKIAHIDKTGEHGLIVAPTNQTTARTKWEDAITLCENLVLGDYDDWYLPTKEELELIYNNREEIGGINATAPYWSSTERSEDTAYCQYFTTGHHYFDYYVYHKANLYSVRAVRKF